MNKPVINKNTITTTYPINELKKEFISFVTNAIIPAKVQNLISILLKFSLQIHFPIFKKIRTN